MDLKTAELAASAAIKMANGALMTIEEVGARLSISPMTVHRMPLPSIRLGRSLRFDPIDVAGLVAASREVSTADSLATLEPVLCESLAPNSNSESRNA